MFKNKRVLIVDDERDLTGALALRLSAGWGFIVAVAHDGAEGLRKAAVFRPDIILLDIAMPGIDGWEMCRRLRDDPNTRNIPLIIMTAWPEKGYEQRASQEGAIKVVLKPIDDQALLVLLRDHVGTAMRR
ncbi:MAG: response regulator [Elusimicrobia bacterium]|nr:response regulator [Elusimicrobiota bacterium]